MKIYDLACEYQVEALGVNTFHPVFSWKLSGKEKGLYQRACRITILGNAGKVLTDTGRLYTDVQTGIEVNLEGKLEPFTRYEFHVSIWKDDDPLPSAMARSFFVTGVFKAHQWSGMWFDKTWGPYGQVGFYRREFEVTEPIAYAYLFLGSVGEKAHSASAYLNGSRLDDLPMFPGATESFHAVYTCMDVRNQLRQGTNTLGLLLLKRGSCVLRICYQSGREETVAADWFTWKYRMYGPYVKLGYENPMCRGKVEIYDAAKTFDGWCENGFDESEWDYYEKEVPQITWGPLFITPQYCSTREEKKIRPVKILKRIEAAACSGVTASSETDAVRTVWFIDFGVNLSGFVSFRLKGKTGSTITIRYAEKKTEDGIGCVYAKEYPAYGQYTFATDEVEEYIPQFLTVGFCCVEIEGYEGEITEDDLTAHYVHSEILTQTDFTCSDPSLERLNEVTRRSFLCNLVNIPTDCPERERRGWTADAYSVCEAECVHFEMHTFLSQWFEAMRDCQRGNGWIPVELPICTEECIDVNWPVACTFITWEMYRQYGDLRFLNRYYDMLQRFSDLLLELCDEEYGIADQFMSYKDWLAIEPASSAFIGVTYLYRNTFLMSRIAEVTGRTEDAVYYQEKAEQIRESLNRRFYHRDGERVWYDNGTQSANAHVLFFDICPSEDRDAIVCALAQDIRKKKTNTTGFMGTMCLLSALSENGQADTAYELLTNRRPGGWLYLIEQYGATTFPENYDGSGSQNHAFLGSAPGLWLYKYLAGISLLEPGYKQIRIRPYVPDGLDYAGAVQDTIRGPIASRWQRCERGMCLTVSIPANTTARVEWKGRVISLESGEYELMLEE